MFYRVDYMLAVLCAGFIAGWLFGKRTARLKPDHLGFGYYVATAVLLLVRAAAFTGYMVLPEQRIWNGASGITADLTGFLFGALFGLALRRNEARDFLVDRSVLDALRMTIAFTFILAGIGKAFSMGPMTEFFTQSGYSIAFLKFIVIAEILGSIGLLLPWAVVPALIGLSIDMLGAVITHVHNGDPLNDSTGAIGLLIRLAALAVLWMLRPKHNQQRAATLRGSVLRVCALFGVCLLIAAGGSRAMRHPGVPAPMTSPASK
ncbi:MAG: DoxX family protein [Actinomycetota bacterium]